MSEAHLILLFKNYSQMIRCENRKCNSNNKPGEPFKKAYSWMHVKDLGWTFKRADLWQGKKASPYNPDICTENGVYVEVYCPECSKEVI